jgi:hypothetical protein
MPWTPCSCSLQHTLLYFSFLKLPEEDNFPTTEQINSNPCQTPRISKIYAKRSLLFWSSLCLSVSLSVCLSTLFSYTRTTGPVIKCSTEYTKPERSLRRGARLKIRSLLQKDSTRRGHLRVREREIYLREKSSSFTAVVIVIAWPHLVCDGRALTPTRERAGTGKTTAQDIALNVPGRNSRLLAAILLLCNGIFYR